MTARTLRPHQRCRVHVHEVTTGDDAVIHQDERVLFEAPNWSPDGKHLLLNGDGVLWSIDVEHAAQAERRPVPVTIDRLPEINNDHVPSPDGACMYLSASDGHIHRAGIRASAGGVIATGQAEPITQDDALHFLHGVSPDGERLAYVRMPRTGGPGRLAVVPASGGESALINTGPGHIDGPEWSPDGEWIFLNTERWAERPGHAQIARVQESGGEMERLVTSDTADWFPHLSPDGARAVYLEFPPGTEGHPENRPVTLVVVATRDWSTPLERIPLFGGQGTINVNSWSPDSTRFAYVSYPIGV